MELDAAHEVNGTSMRSSRIEHYRQKVGDSIFVSMNDNTFRSGEVEISIVPVELDTSELYSVMPCDRQCIEESAGSYEWVVRIVWEEEENIDGWLTFVLTNVRYKWNGIEQKEIFEDWIWLPEAYRWWDVALDIYKAMLRFAQSMWVKKVNSDSSLTKWSASIYERLQELWHAVHLNASANWDTEDADLRSEDWLPNYSIEL